jgi:hypothetical protein
MMVRIGLPAAWARIDALDSCWWINELTCSVSLHIVGKKCYETGPHHILFQNKDSSTKTAYQQRSSTPKSKISLDRVEPFRPTQVDKLSPFYILFEIKKIEMKQDSDWPCWPILCECFKCRPVISTELFWVGPSLKGAIPGFPPREISPGWLLGQFGRPYGHSDNILHKTMIETFVGGLAKALLGDFHVLVSWLVNIN